MVMKVVIDRDLCQGHSVCLGECPEVFDVVEEDEGYPMVKVLIENPPEELRDKVMKAANYCPNSVITIVEE
ncbi:MAG: ferredoxin [Pseudomonadales bacterium]|nr:ferredoxin [Pseudomonadales bacterium]